MIRRAIEINDNLADAFPNVPSFESEQVAFSLSSQWCWLPLATGARVPVHTPG